MAFHMGYAMEGTRPDIPGVGAVGKRSVALLHGISRRLHGMEERKYTFRHISPGSGVGRHLRQIIDLLNYTKTSGSFYNAHSFPAGYSTLEIDGTKLAGQRNPIERFSRVPLDFSQMTVLDVGCNQGGMLFEIAGKIRHGVGIDYDAHMINAANRIRSITKANNLDFYVLDLEKENLDLIGDLIPDEKVNVAFLLSVCMWIRNWKQVVSLMPQVSEMLLFESNGSRGQQDAQLAHVKTLYKMVRLLSERSDDDSSQKNRSLYLCA
ncbi:MAG: methyltransferase domain-containing protein [Deltaproteobacteria bacterium]|nr:methyltransferase domain-containing protein [Deltaproteobacteria bacterium]